MGAHTFFKMKKSAALAVFAAASISSSLPAFSQQPEKTNPQPPFGSTDEKLPFDSRFATALSLDMPLATAEIHTFNIDLDTLLLRNAFPASSLSSSIELGVPGQTFQMALPGRQGLDHFIIKYVESLDSIRSISGYIEGYPFSRFTITIDGAEVLGRIHLESKTFVIEKARGTERHIVTVIDKSMIPPEAYKDDTYKSDQQGQLISKAIRQTDEGSILSKTYASEKSLPENGNVRVLFIYTPDVQNRNNISSLTNNIIAELNSASLDSQVQGHYYFTKAGQYLVNDNLPYCHNHLLTRMTNNTEVFSGLGGTQSSTMNQYKADIAMLVVTTESGEWFKDNCTPDWGRIGGGAINFRVDGGPYATTTDTYALGDLTGPHEIGHVLGGVHPNDSVRSSQVPSSARGWVKSTGNQFQTLMGNYEGCGFDGIPSDCERIVYWSNPSLYINGSYIGDSSSDMESALEGSSGKTSTMHAVSGWTSDTISRPNSPSNFSLHDEQCYGLHTADWSSSSGADHYQLLMSTSSSFTNPTVIWRGSATSTGFTVNSGTWYVRVRACNRSGCSGTGTQKSASYFNGCL